jgi:galactose-1-phosphate uridylyltransferase
MKILKSRKEYKSKFKNFNTSSKCVFCSFKNKLIIKNYKNWTWVFAEFPYFKYHTMLVPKSHAIGFTNLTGAEILELSLTIKEIENKYKDKKIIGIKSLYGTHLNMSWRTRWWDSDKKFLEHFHLHVWPEFEGGFESILDDKAWDIDINLLK